MAVEDENTSGEYMHKLYWDRRFRPNEPEDNHLTIHGKTILNYKTMFSLVFGPVNPRDPNPQN